jgi:hypothetical protein
MPETRSIGEILRDAEAGRLETIFAEDRERYDIIGAADRLFDLLEERRIDYVLVGGMAMLQYVEGRNTRDIDLIVDAAALSRLPELAVSSRDRDFARADFDGIQLDLLLTANKVFELVRATHTASVVISGRPTPCATPQGLLILKLFALPSLYRQGDNARAAVYEADIAYLFAAGKVNVEAALSALSPHMLATDIGALRETVSELRKRGAQFGPASAPQSESRTPSSEL